MTGPPSPDRNAVAFAERLLTVLHEGRYTSTYKYAVLLALIDLCLEHSTRTGEAPQSVTTAQLADKVLELYWPHTQPWEPPADTPLRQNNTGQAEILTLIARFRSRWAPDPSTSLVRARLFAPSRFGTLQREVEWKLVEMPLPRLQMVGDHHDAFIYRINWNQRITRREFIGAEGDNTVRFIGDAGDHLVRLAGLLRPLIQREWAALVAQFNKLPEGRLEEFLFGIDRASLAVLREPLRELDGGPCFYCGNSVRNAFQIDHFIPWSRFSDNGLGNLVVADTGCNQQKRDHLASDEHVERWRHRAEVHASHLDEIARDVRWEHEWPRTEGVARAIYLRLPPRASLWRRGREFVPVDRGSLRRIFS